MVSRFIMYQVFIVMNAFKCFVYVCALLICLCVGRGGWEGRRGALLYALIFGL